MGAGVGRVNGWYRRRPLSEGPPNDWSPVEIQWPYGNAKVYTFPEWWYQNDSGYCIFWHAYEDGWMLRGSNENHESIYYYISNPASAWNPVGNFPFAQPGSAPPSEGWEVYLPHGTSPAPQLHLVS